MTAYIPHRAPEGFSITRVQEDDDPFNTDQYVFTVSLKLTQNASREMLGEHPEYQEAFLEDGLKRYARAVLERCEEVLR